MYIGLNHLNESNEEIEIYSTRRTLNPMLLLVFVKVHQSRTRWHEQPHTFVDDGVFYVRSNKNVKTQSKINENTQAG